MKKQVSPVAVILIVVLTFGLVLRFYWKGLLAEPEVGGGPAGGGPGGPPPPPIVGLANATVSTLAGPVPDTPEASERGWQDGKSASVRFDGPAGIAITPSGFLYVTDTRNHRLRKIAPDGTVTTVAGSGALSSARGGFADGPPQTARMWNPSGIGVAPNGAVRFTDAGNHRVRQLMGSDLTTLAGGDTALDHMGLADGGMRDGVGASARFRYPTGLAIQPDGALIVVDTGNRHLRKVLPDGTTSTIADLGAAGAQSPCGVARLPAGGFLVADPGTENIYQVTGDGQVTILPGINKDSPIWVHPTGIALDATGTVYVADTGSHCIMRLTPGSAPQVVAGIVPIDIPAAPAYGEGTGAQSTFAAPCALVAAGPGVLYVADYGNNCVRKIVISPPVQSIVTDTETVDSP